MPDVITALQADPLDDEKVHIFIDGRHLMTVALDVAAAERLAVGQEMPAQRLERLHRAEELQAIFDSALRFLAYRPRSEREVEMRLRKKGYSPEQIAIVLERLRRNKYVDDKEFARFWVSNRMAFSPRGPRLLRSELRQKGVDQEIVDEILGEQAEAQAEAVQQAEETAEAWGDTLGDAPAPGTDLANALALAQKKMRVYGTLDPQTARRRLSGFLMRRGYNYDVVGEVIRRLLVEPDDADDGD